MSYFQHVLTWVFALVMFSFGFFLGLYDTETRDAYQSNGFTKTVLSDLNISKHRIK